MMYMRGPTPPAWLLLDPNTRSKLDPDYLDLHDQQVCRQNSKQPLLRPKPSSVQDVVFQLCHIERIPCRVYSTTHQFQPDRCVVWVVGGGSVHVELDGDEDTLMRLSYETGAMVVVPQYAQAPLHAHPAQLHDVVKVLQAVKTKGLEGLDLFPQQIVLGGASSGANLAVVAALTASVHLAGLVMVVPVLDHTADEMSASWRKNLESPGFPPRRARYYRIAYQDSPGSMKRWDTSPIFAQDQDLRRLPNTLVQLAAQDLVFAEGQSFAQRLSHLGVGHCIVYEGTAHPMLRFNQYLHKGFQAQQDLIGFVKEKFEEAHARLLAQSEARARTLSET